MDKMLNHVLRDGHVVKKHQQLLDVVKIQQNRFGHVVEGIDYHLDALMNMRRRDGVVVEEKGMNLVVLYIGHVVICQCQIKYVAVSLNILAVMEI